MKRFLTITAVFTIFAGAFVSCDHFERTEVKPTISVNHLSATLFEGEQIQLTASPTSLSFSWSTTEDDVANVDATGLVTAVKQGTASIVCTSGDMSFTTEIIVNKKIALTDVILRCDPILELGLGSTRNVPVSLVPSEANDIDVTDYAWSSDDETVARVNAAGTIKGVKEGTTVIHYRKGSFRKEVSVVVGKTFPLFKGQPFVVSKTPSTLWFRDFDRGGEGNAFFDTGGGPGNTYRANNGDPTSSKVTIEAGGNIGYLTGGEWYVYSIDVLDAGDYTIVINLASAAGSDGRYRFDLDDKPITEPFPMQRSGGWGSFIDVEVDVTLPAGQHRLKFVAEDGQHNPKHMTFHFKG